MPEFVDPYLDPSCGILRNLVGARTQDELDLAEFDLVHARAVELRARPSLVRRTGDLAELRAIHRHLFQDIYSWAGEIRIVDIAKHVDDAEYFLPASHIQQGAGFAAAELAADEQMRGLGRRRFVERLAHHYDQFNYVHPFREGNGRTQRAFWDRIAHDAGWRLDWLQVAGEVNDRASRAASEQSDLGPLVEMFDLIVLPR